MGRTGSNRGLRRPLAAAVALHALLVLPVACGAELYTWASLPELPQRLGVGTPCAGVSNGALVLASGARGFVLEDPNGRWQSGGPLEHPLAHGASATTPDGIVCLGGSDGGRYSDAVFRLRWIDGRIEQAKLADLPRPCANTSAAVAGNVIYVAGGQETPESATAMKNFWALDLSRANPEWEILEPWPGPARVLAAASAQDGAFYLAGGAELLPDAGGSLTRRLLTDTYRYRPGEGWKRIADLPTPVVGAPATAEGQAHVVAFGRDVLAYHTITDTWASMGEIPAGHMATAAVPWNDAVVIPGRESPAIYIAHRREAKSHFDPLDYAAMGLYLTSLVLMGLYLSRRGKRTEDFFLAGRRIPWWAAGLSIYGTQLSSISFMAIPAKVYATDWVYFMANVAIVAIMPLVVWFYLPFFRRLRVTTAYEYLEKRFNLPVRLFASVAFILYQLGRMAIVLFLPAIALSTVTGISVYACILVMGLLCTFYTVLGGIEAVIWTDVLQVIVLVGGAFLSLLLIIYEGGGISNVVALGLADDKFRMFNWSWDFTTTAVWVVLIGNMFANLGPYTSDQTVVQRYLTTKDERQAARSIWTNAALVIPGTVIWFGLGTALYAFYKSQPERLDPSAPTDAIFPLFIAQQLPAGVSGLIIAALFAASMSTLDSSLNSVSTAMVTDFFRRFRPAAPDSFCLSLARWLTALLGILATGTGVLLATYNIGSLWDIFQEVMGLFGGALAGLFALGIFTRRTSGSGALVGAIASAVVLYVVQSRTPVHFFLYALVGVLTCMVVGYTASLMLPSRRKDLAGLTVFTKGGQLR